MFGWLSVASIMNAEQLAGERGGPQYSLRGAISALETSLYWTNLSAIGLARLVRAPR